MRTRQLLDVREINERQKVPLLKNHRAVYYFQMKPHMEIMKKLVLFNTAIGRFHS
jgi:hypothetical protein